MESRPLADQNCPPKRNRDASHVNVASASPARLNGGSQNGAASAAAAAVSSHHPPRGCLLPAPLTVSSASLTAVDRLPAAPVPHVTQSNDNFKPTRLKILIRGDFLGALNCMFPDLQLLYADTSGRMPVLDQTFSLFSETHQNLQHIFSSAKTYRSEVARDFRSHQQRVQRTADETMHFDRAAVENIDDREHRQPQSHTNSACSEPETLPANTNDKSEITPSQPKSLLNTSAESMTTMPTNDRRRTPEAVLRPARAPLPTNPLDKDYVRFVDEQLHDRCPAKCTDFRRIEALIGYMDRTGDESLKTKQIAPFNSNLPVLNISECCQQRQKIVTTTTTTTTIAMTITMTTTTTTMTTLNTFACLSTKNNGSILTPIASAGSNQSTSSAAPMSCVLLSGRAPSTTTTATPGKPSYSAMLKPTTGTAAGTLAVAAGQPRGALLFGASAATASYVAALPMQHTNVATSRRNHGQKQQHSSNADKHNNMSANTASSSAGGPKAATTRKGVKRERGRRSNRLKQTISFERCDVNDYHQHVLMGGRKSQTPAPLARNALDNEDDAIPEPYAGAVLTTANGTKRKATNNSAEQQRSSSGYHQHVDDLRPHLFAYRRNNTTSKLPSAMATRASSAATAADAVSSGSSVADIGQRIAMNLYELLQSSDDSITSECGPPGSGEWKAATAVATATASAPVDKHAAATHDRTPAESADAPAIVSSREIFLHNFRVLQQKALSSTTRQRCAERQRHELTTIFLRQQLGVAGGQQQQPKQQQQVSPMVGPNAPATSTVDTPVVGRETTLKPTTSAAQSTTTVPRLKETMSELELQALQQYRTSDESMDEKYNRLEREAQEQYPY